MKSWCWHGNPHPTYRAWRNTNDPRGDPRGGQLSGTFITGVCGGGRSSGKLFSFLTRIRISPVEGSRVSVKPGLNGQARTEL